MDDAEAIKRKMMEQMQRQLEEEQKMQEEKQIIEAQKKAILRNILDSEARGRLERIRMAKPHDAEVIENQLISLYQMGRIRERLNDETFKILLKHLMPKKKEINIRRI
ncbi:MAG: DNA-binding protein [Thermoplasmata archaeon]|nr:DNA-binding protein [Thermoplasmata archaeon]